jgi:hypothetical protein
MPMTSPSNNGPELVLGAVAYDQKVVPIWDGFLHYFHARGLSFDYVLFSNYERQVEALCAGTFTSPGTSPLAWLQTERIAATLGRVPTQWRCAIPIATCTASSSCVRRVASKRSQTFGARSSPSARETLRRQR